MSGYNWFLLISLSILWGGSFYFVGVIIQELPPLTIVFSRVFLAALVLAPIIWLTSDRASRLPWKDFFIMALLNNAIPFALITWGQQHIASGLAAIMNAATPLFTIIVAQRLTTDEKATPNKVAGVVLGISGVALLIGVDAVTASNNQIAGEVAILGAALSYAFASVFGRRFRSHNLPNTTIAGGQVTASSVILLPLVLLLDQPWILPMPSAPVILSILGLGLLSTALAYIIYFKILSSAGATNLMLVTLLVPVTATLLGSWLLNESLETSHYLGMGLIGAGLLLIDQRIGGSLKFPAGNRK